MTQIQPLSRSQLRPALNLLGRSFPRPPLSEHPVISLPLSLCPHFLLALAGLTTLHYWVAISDGKVVGVTGLYRWRSQPETAWLGWTCVEDSYRHQGVGRALVQAAVNAARSDGCLEFRLWTTKQPEYASGNRLFQAMGFLIELETSSSNNTRLERVLNLASIGNQSGQL